MRKFNDFVLDLPTIRVKLIVDEGGAEKDDLDFLNSWIDFIKIEITEDVSVKEDGQIEENKLKVMEE